ncbi:Putative arginine/ornithine antiporter [Providencia rustigianii]|nr:Putative arginine/ornithine antiporter [Providencia rustigianii]
MVKVAYSRHSKALLAVGLVASIYGLWLLYASGLINLMLSVVLYAPGILLFLYARSQQTSKAPLKLAEKILIIAIAVASVPALYYLLT